MAKKTKPQWQGFLLGSLLALGMYLCGLLILALFLVRGTLSEGAAVPVMVVLCGVSALSGGWLTVRRTALRTGGVLTGIILAAILSSVALCCWEEIAWLSHGGVLLLSAIAGGLLATLLSGRRRRRTIRRK